MVRWRTKSWSAAAAAGAVLLAGGVIPTASAAVTNSESDYEWGNVAISGGGYVPGIIYNQTEEGLVYARTDIGGAYRLDRDTDQWVPLLDHIGWDDWNLLGILSLATDPTETSRVYAAAGMYTNDWDPNNGAILRSADYGTTWEKTTLPFKVGGNMPGRGIGERLQIDPNNSDVLYFGAEDGQGLWRSTDAGVTFAQVESFPNVGNFAPDPNSDNSYLRSELGVLWTAFDKASSAPGSATSTIFTAVADKEHILYRSDDAGATWSEVPGAPTGFLPQRGVIDESGRFLYISTTDTSGPYDGSDGEVWRYGLDDGVWTDITPTYRPVGGDFGFAGLTVDQSNPDTIMVVSQIQWWPDILIFRSTDRGETWSPIWEYADGNTQFVSRYQQTIDEVPWLRFGSELTAPAPFAQTSPKLGWMVSSLEIDPHNSDELMYGTGATIYRSDDLTAWDEPNGAIHLRPAADGIEETAIQDLVAPAGEVDLVSAMLDLGGFVHRDIDVVTDTFEGPYFGGGTSVDIAGLAPEVFARAGTDGSGAHVAAVSVDSGLTWTVSPTIDGSTHGGFVAVTADGEGVVWAPEGGAPQFTSDSGATWSAVSGLPVGARVEADRVNAEIVYGYVAGAFYRSEDGGATFVLSNSTALPAEGNVRFGAMPGHPGEIWFAGGDEDGAYGMWRSTNAGTSWAPVAGFDEADAVGFGKAAPGQTRPAIYTAAKREGVRGVFQSIDGGASWTRINDDAHQWGWIGAAITGDPDMFGRVYIGTNGRGIITGDDLSASQPADWERKAVYQKGDVVAYDGAIWKASWWTSLLKPGSPVGPWQEIATTDSGTAAWTRSRIFDKGDVVIHDGSTWRAKWWSRGNEPGKKYGPWERING